MIILGLLLLLLGYLLSIGILTTLGWIFLIIGLVLLAIGMVSSGVGGRKWYY